MSSQPSASDAVEHLAGTESRLIHYKVTLWRRSVHSA